MPDFDNCVLAGNGKLYCWDNNVESYIEIEWKYIPVKLVPADAITGLMIKTSMRKKEEENNA